MKDSNVNKLKNKADVLTNNVKDLKTIHELKQLSVEERYDYFMTLKKDECKTYFASIGSSPYRLKGDLYKQMMAVYVDRSLTGGWNE